MKRILFLSTLILFFVTSCAFGQDVRYNFDKNINFSKFKTYKWVILKDAPTANDLVTKQLKDAVDAELATKGLTKINDDTANLFIGYQAGVGQEKQFTSYSSDWEYGGGWYRGGWYSPGAVPLPDPPRLSTSANWFWTCTIPQIVIWSGGELQAKPWIQRPNQINKRRTWQMRSRSC